MTSDEVKKIFEAGFKRGVKYIFDNSDVFTEKEKSSYCKWLIFNGECFAIQYANQVKRDKQQEVNKMTDENLEHYCDTISNKYFTRFFRSALMFLSSEVRDEVIKSFKLSMRNDLKPYLERIINSEMSTEQHGRECAMYRNGYRYLAKRIGEHALGEKIPELSDREISSLILNKYRGK